MRLFEDETDLPLFPPPRAGWAQRGQPAPVPISGGNAKRVPFGALNIGTGYRVFLPRQHQRGADFRAFLGLVRQRYRGRYVAPVPGEDSSRTAGASRAPAGELGVELPGLPARSPHLNPVDHRWRHGKEVKCGNHQYGSIEGQAESFAEYLDGLTPEQALLKAGVLPDDFWIW